MNKALHVSEHLYRVMLRLYPLEHRHVYGKQMVQTFRELCRDFSPKAALWRWELFGWKH